MGHVEAIALASGNTGKAGAMDRGDDVVSGVAASETARHGAGRGEDGSALVGGDDRVMDVLCTGSLYAVAAALEAFKAEIV